MIFFYPNFSFLSTPSSSSCSSCLYSSTWCDGRSLRSSLMIQHQSCWDWQIGKEGERLRVRDSRREVKIVKAVMWAEKVCSVGRRKRRRRRRRSNAREVADCMFVSAQVCPVCRQSGGSSRSWTQLNTSLQLGSCEQFRLIIGLLWSMRPL